jgi:hypothetical protein
LGREFSKKSPNWSRSTSKRENSLPVRGVIFENGAAIFDVCAMNIDIRAAIIDICVTNIDIRAMNIDICAVIFNVCGMI